MAHMLQLKIGFAGMVTPYYSDLMRKGESEIPIQKRSFPIDRDTLHFLIRSPSIQFMYWQLSSSKQRLLKEHYKKDWRELTPALRFHADAGATNADPLALHILELHLPAGESCFISGLHPGRTYYASLGIYNEQGHFLPLLHSNTIEVPVVDAKNQFHADDAVSPFIYQPASILIKQVTPDAHEHFSAYSVYIPKYTYSVDMESGGDTD